MPSQKLVIDEWLLHDLNGDNGFSAREESMVFLNKLVTKCDKIVTLGGSPWLRKAYDLCEYRDTERREISRYLHLKVLRNLDKCIFLYQSEIKDIPASIKDRVPEEDVYLLETYFSAQAHMLITSDNRLYEVLSGKMEEIGIALRDEFLGKYLASDNEQEGGN